MLLNFALIAFCVCLNSCCGERIVLESRVLVPDAQRNTEKFGHKISIYLDRVAIAELSQSISADLSAGNVAALEEIDNSGSVSILSLRSKRVGERFLAYVYLSS